MDGGGGVCDNKSRIVSILFTFGLSRHQVVRCSWDSLNKGATLLFFSVKEIELITQRSRIGDPLSSPVRKYERVVLLGRERDRIWEENVLVNAGGWPLTLSDQRVISSHIPRKKKTMRLKAKLSNCGFNSDLDHVYFLLLVLMKGGTEWIVGFLQLWSDRLCLVLQFLVLWIPFLLGNPWGNRSTRRHQQLSNSQPHFPESSSIWSLTSFCQIMYRVLSEVLFVAGLIIGG